MEEKRKQQIPRYQMENAWEEGKLEKVEVMRLTVIRNDIPQLPNRKVEIYWDMNGEEIGKKDPALMFKDILGLDDELI